MPMINGRYYMNPQYGAALESARAADEESVRANGAPQPSWLNRFLGLVPTDREQEQINRRSNLSGGIFRETAEKANAYEPMSQNVPAGTQSPNPRVDDATVGNSVYNETSGLRPTAPSGAGSAQDLSNARVGLAGVTKNRDASGTAVGKGTAPGRLAKTEANATKTYPPAKHAFEDSRDAASKASGDPAGPQHFYFDFGQGKPDWTQGKQPKESYGPFRNPSGGGDVPKNVDVWIRVYD